MAARSNSTRKFKDPDIASIIEQSGGQIDPYEVVRKCVISLLDELKYFEVSFKDAFERIRILASLAGFEVKAIEGNPRVLEGQDAIIVPLPRGNKKKGTIFYNPDRSLPRIVFSIAHEITHSFFPASQTGARFRSLSPQGSKGGRELEMLCHFGASELTMPLFAFLPVLERHGFDLDSVDLIRRDFGTSYEACLYRMAQVTPFPAAAGLFRFRFRIGEAETVANQSPNLFSRSRNGQEVPTKKYRRQSFYYSDTFPNHLVMPWNKSVPETSIIYHAAVKGSIQRGVEEIPVNGRGSMLKCHLQAIPAPYQSEDTNSGHPDILFLLSTITD